MGRCWVATMFGRKCGPRWVAHHQIPFRPTPDRVPDVRRRAGAELQRLLSRRSPTGSGWSDYRTGTTRFGLGRPTGSGSPRRSGRVIGTVPRPGRPAPVDDVVRRHRPGLGGGDPDPDGQRRRHHRPRRRVDAPDVAEGARGGRTASSATGRSATSAKVDLHIPAGGDGLGVGGDVQRGQRGAGTGKKLVAGDPVLMAAKIAGKTGTAPPRDSGRRSEMRTAAWFSTKRASRSSSFLEPSTPEKPNPRAPGFGAPGSGRSQDAGSRLVYRLRALRSPAVRVRRHGGIRRQRWRRRGLGRAGNAEGLHEHEFLKTPPAGPAQAAAW